MDILPTIAHMADVDLPEEHVVDEKNIFELFSNPEGPGSPHAYFSYYLLDQIKAIRVGDSELYLPLDRYVDMWGKDLGPVKAKLYSLKDDIHERLISLSNFLEKLKK